MKQTSPLKHKKGAPLATLSDQAFSVVHLTPTLTPLDKFKKKN
jgi:hypothetical protein